MPPTNSDSLDLSRQLQHALQKIKDLTTGLLSSQEGGLAASRQGEGLSLRNGSGSNILGLIDNLNVGVFRFTIDGEGAFVMANPALAEMAGYDSVEELLQASVTMLYPEPRERMFFAREIIKARFVRNFELPLIRKGGEIFWASVSAAVHFDGNEKPRWVDGVVEDITARRRSEEALRQSEERFRSLSENAPDIIYTLGPDGAFTYVNKAWRRILGHDPREVVGHYFVDFAPKGHDAEFRKLFKTVRDGKQTLYVTRPLVDKQGLQRHFAMSGAPNFDSEGKLVGMVGMLKDMTRQMRAERALRDSEASLARAQKLAGLGNWELRIRDDRFTCSPEILNIYGISPQHQDNLLGKILASFHPEDAQYVQDCIDSTLHLDRAVSFEHRVVTSGDKQRVLRQVVSAIRDEGGHTVSLVGVVQDITEIRASEEQMRLLARVFENTVEGIMVTNVDGVIEMVNDAFMAITGYRRDQAIGKKPSMLSSGRHDLRYYEQMWRELKKQGHWQGEIWNRRCNGEAYPEWLNITGIQDQQGNVTHYVGVFHDITEAKRSEERITHQAYHDALTGLPNRSLFNDRLSMAIAQAQRSGQGVALLFLDLDNFKNINDSLGHATGDMLLQSVAHRLSGLVREQDSVARLGGDEFIFLLQGTMDPDFTVHVAQRILAAFRKPFFIKDHELFVTTSIGIAMHPHDGRDPEVLVSCADLAMFRAKEEGRNKYKLFKPAMNDKVQRRMSLEADLRRALERREFEVYYQPKVDVEHQNMVGVEALVRWRRPGHGLVPPDEFIPICEETGLIIPLGAWVLEQACQTTRQWHDQGHGDLHVAVNLSPRQFQDKDLVRQIKMILLKTGLPPNCLELEITESVVMHSVEDAIITMRALTDLGLRLSMDDFGRGYSSLYHLKRFPMSTLKIDRSFVADVANDPDDASIVNTIISMSRSLNLQVVAEGVETREQLEFLRQRRCDQMQGYYFSKPLSAEDLLSLLKSRTVAP